jgi:hypothetical protein
VQCAGCDDNVRTGKPRAHVGHGSGHRVPFRPSRARTSGVGERPTTWNRASG